MWSAVSRCAEPTPRKTHPARFVTGATPQRPAPASRCGGRTATPTIARPARVTWSRGCSPAAGGALPASQQRRQAERATVRQHGKRPRQRTSPYSSRWRPRSEHGTWRLQQRRSRLPLRRQRHPRCERHYPHPPLRTQRHPQCQRHYPHPPLRTQRHPQCERRQLRLQLARPRHTRRWRPRLRPMWRAPRHPQRREHPRPRRSLSTRREHSQTTPRQPHPGTPTRRCSIGWSNRRCPASRNSMAAGSRQILRHSGTSIAMAWRTPRFW
jgi:hypothetical protein